MAIVSSHTLNGVDGTHAAGIEVALTRLGDAVPLFSTRMDAGGRLSEQVDLTGADNDATYELVFQTGPYWQARNLSDPAAQIIAEIVLRFAMPDPDATYHRPVILSPNSYSVCWSS